MKVAFNSSTEDITALHEALLKRQRAEGKAVNPHKQLISIAFWMAILIAAVWYLFGEPPYVLMVLTSLFILIYATRHTSIERKNLRKYFEKTRGGDGWLACIIEISDHGVSMVSSDSVTAFWWPQISEIVREDEFLRFYTTMGSVAQVPLRVFRTPDELKQFEDEARRLLAEHQNEPPAAFPETSGMISDDRAVPSCRLINPTLSPSPSEPL